MLFRLLILALLFYLATRVFSRLFSSRIDHQETQVHGPSQPNALDLSDEDVEDVDYKELPRNK
ncbi:MAG TPA: hypothetical protein PKY55_17210 [bacterium]|jgi:hypothetical protein|nr:hypothetical protein [bacterium]HOC90682.1 hypothetical protein [bacterium]HOY44257.1 hypothetical protein [bacterium]HPG85022.1 hypothetical protein [bacterium]HPM58790.1 hypothetical protein [bacterium]